CRPRHDDPVFGPLGVALVAQPFPGKDHDPLDLVISGVLAQHRVVAPRTLGDLSLDHLSSSTRSATDRPAADQPTTMRHARRHERYCAKAWHGSWGPLRRGAA